MGFVYSTDKEFKFEQKKIVQQTLPNDKQMLKLRFEVKGRAGKPVTIVSNFIGKEEDIEKLAKDIKNFCATGGSIKDGEIIIQGNSREKVKNFLEKEGYKIKG